MNKKYVYILVVLIALSISLYLYESKVAVLDSSYAPVNTEPVEVVVEKPVLKEKPFVVSGLIATSSINRVAVSVEGLISECVLSDTTEFKTLSFSSTTIPEKGDRVVVSYDKTTKKPAAVILQRGAIVPQGEAPLSSDVSVGSVIGFSKGLITVKEVTGTEKSVDSSGLLGIVLQVFGRPAKMTIGERADITCIKEGPVSIARSVELYK